MPAHVSCVFYVFPSHLLPDQPPRRRSPFVEAARSAASFMDGCVGAGEAADVMETRNIHMKPAHACILCDIDLAM